MNLDPINIKSDTQTLPTDEMFRAIATAQLGDDTYDDDPTVQKFEAMAAQRMGMQAAMLTISGNMANLAALMTHARHGDEVILDRESHIFYYEEGGLANIAGLMPMPVQSRNGMLDPEDLAAAIRSRNLHYPRPKLLCLENTHNRSGGRVIPPDLFKQLCDVARQHELAVHLDGARIFNAAIAACIEPTEYTRHVDSVMFCLSKGLSCPLGSVLCGSKAFIEQADFNRKRLGGGMRQAGVIAAPGIVALEKMVDRLADDHANAQYLAQQINQIARLTVNMACVETNMVYIDHTETGLTTGDVLKVFKSFGIIASGRPPAHVRFCTNRHHNRAVLDEVLRRLRLAMEQIQCKA